MKRFLILAAVLLLVIVSAVGCTDDLDQGEFGGKPFFVMPIYIGEDLTVTDHVFTNDEFQVLVSYDDGTHKEVTDFEIVETTFSQGAYSVVVKWRDLEGDAFIMLNKSAFLEEADRVE